MATRQRSQDIGASRGRRLIEVVARDLGSARSNAGLSQEAVSDAAGVSRSAYGRIERGEDRRVSIPTLARIAVALGLELSVRLYPAGDPVRDAGQLALIGRVIRRLHPRLRVRTEVPFSRPGDSRAWDALIIGFDTRITCALEAETRPTDVQALDRKLALKQRDGGADRLVLVLADTRHNRAFIRGPGELLRLRFPVPGTRALERLAAGVDPGGNAILLI